MLQMFVCINNIIVMVTKPKYVVKALALQSVYIRTISPLYVCSLLSLNKNTQLTRVIKGRVIQVHVSSRTQCPCQLFPLDNRLVMHLWLLLFLFYYLLKTGCLLVKDYRFVLNTLALNGSSIKLLIKLLSYSFH